MKLSYIFHSGFAIETNELTIIVDFFEDTISKNKGIVHDRLLKNEGDIYVLSSHSHFDHFNPEVLKWKQARPDIKYIFSKDILDEGCTKPEDAVYLKKGDNYTDDRLKITAFGSTDIGISFLIELEDKLIFHAGDLNNWHWKDESTQDEIAEAENAYLTELDLLSESAGYLDLAMFPVDPRLGKDYMLGAEQFVDKIDVGLFVPMHFGFKYEKANAFKGYADQKGMKFFVIKERGNNIDF